MLSAYSELILPTFTGNLRDDAYNFLVANNCPKTAEHSLDVGMEARMIAKRCSVNEEAAEKAGYLHDISAVFPSNIRIEVANELGVEVLVEEEIFPMIIHQKISRNIAKDIFKIQDSEILDAISCHTTLRKNSTALDKVLFVADKIKWDQQGRPPYLNNVLVQLERSIEHAAFEYISYLWGQKENLKVIHPWLADAYNDLKELLG